MDSSIIAEVAAQSAEQISYTHHSRKPLYGLGINDSSTPIWYKGKLSRTYGVWRNMLARCFSTTYQDNCPTYSGCAVDPDWLKFSVFECWMLTQDYESKDLDKDILFPGNTLYSPSTCIFIPQGLNKLLTNSKASRGDCPLGVHFANSIGKYVAQVQCNGKRIHLGTFDTPLEAHQAWQRAKADIIASFPTADPRIRAALDRRVAQLRDDLLHNRITEKL